MGTIVGVEQTQESRPLQEFKFPKKCVLLLGSEKEGIPVELLQQVDICVEIPQQGLIRSLNVHVTGALSCGNMCASISTNKMWRTYFKRKSMYSVLPKKY